jgi:hypothetical protein
MQANGRWDLIRLLKGEAVHQVGFSLHDYILLYSHAEQFLGSSEHRVTCRQHLEIRRATSFCAFNEQASKTLSKYKSHMSNILVQIFIHTWYVVRSFTLKIIFRKAHWRKISDSQR